MKELILNGRLGNVLFELAHAYSNITNEQLCCIVSNQQLSFINHIRQAFNLQFNTKFIYPKKKLQNFEGYFQSESLFNIEKIRQLFTFSQQYQKYVTQFETIHNINYNRCVAMTIRRGDYITLNGIWIVQPKDYYIQAYEKFFNGYTIIVSSDDISWCKNNLKEYPCIFLDDFMSNKVSILCILSYCKHSIGSSSSFSWWVAWLNEQFDSMNIFPSKWYDLTKLKNNQTPPAENIDQILPSRWIKFNQV